jgi:hypothetical protein
MSAIVVAGDTSGSVTLNAPAVSGTTVITLPTTSGTMALSGGAGSFTTLSASGNVTLGSAVLATPSGTAPLYLCRAWVNIMGVDVPSIRASGNVSSITDTGVGIYTINFTTAMPDANYAVTSSVEPYIYTGYGVIGGSGFAGGFNRSTTSYEIKTAYVSGTGGGSTSYDMSTVQVAIFR